MGRRKKDVKRPIKQPKPSELRKVIVDPIPKPDNKSNTRYRPPNQRGDYKPPDDDNKFSVKLTNLPDSVERLQISQLVDPFYRIELEFDKMGRQIPRYRIKVFTGIYDNQRAAIVEFDKKEWAEQAISYFNGKKYQHMILSAEMAKPQIKRT